MLSKMTPATVAQCWYMRRHVPEGRRRKEGNGVQVCVCRYCQRPIRSRDGGRWDLADGIDLDALAGVGQASYFCVVDTLDDMVIARYPLTADMDEHAIADRKEEISEKHGVEDSGGILEVRVVQHRSGGRLLH